MLCFMETFSSPPARTVNRRTFLKVSTLAGLGLAIDPTIQRSLAATREDIKPLIIFMQGGAQSPYEFVSPLTDSPSEFCGPCSTINATNGIRIGEHWKEFAKVAKDTAVIRSLDAQNNEHKSKHLFGGSNELCKQAEQLAHGGIPHPFIALPSNFKDFTGLDPNAGFKIEWNDKEKRYTPPPIELVPHLSKRMDLLRDLESWTSERKPVKLMEKNRELAASLLLGGDKLHAPFKNAEKQTERYGDNEIGRAAALAAEFAKSGAGVTFIYNEFQQGWDMHNDLQARMNQLAPPTDRALAELIRDARRHGFVVLCTTEHGRTPRMNSGAGRDHHNVGYMIGAGGGFAEGMVHGSLDKQGDIKTLPVKADQVMPTTLKACGVDLPIPNNTVKEILKG